MTMIYYDVDINVTHRGRCTTVPVRSSGPLQVVILFCMVLYGVVLITLEQACEVCQRIFRPVCASDGVIIIIIIIFIIIIIALNDHNKNADRRPTRTSARSVLKLVNAR